MAEVPGGSPSASRAQKVRMLLAGLAAAMVCLAAIVVLSPLKVQYGELDPYKVKSGPTELLGYDTTELDEQDPFQNEQLALGDRRTRTTELSSRDLAALRLLRKSRFSRQAQDSTPIESERAARLLEKARAGLATRGPEIQQLITSAKRLDRELHHKPLLAEQAESRLRRFAAAHQVTRGGKPNKAGLYFTSGGYGPYPSDDYSNVGDNWDDEEGPAVAEVTDGRDGDDSDVDTGNYERWSRSPEAWNSFAPAVAAIGAAVSKSSPLDWFLYGPQQSASSAPVVVVSSAVNHPRPLYGDDGRDYDEYEQDSAPAAASAAPAEAAGDSGEATPVLERVNKLIDLKKKSDDIEAEQARVMDDVYRDAEDGGMAKLGGGPEAKAYSQGFLQGAVEASKKSLEQQAEFEDMLRRQEDVVNRLEDAVWELEEHQREENWAKTASQYPDEQPATAAAPPAAPAAAPAVAAAAPAVAAAPAAPAAPAPAAPAPAPAAPPKKLTIGEPDQAAVAVFDVDFYMEAMCPGCQHFTVNVLPPVLDALEGHIRLRAIPYGNAAIVNGSVVCQHGPDECAGNKVELCMMKRYPDWTVWFPVFKCIEASEVKPLDAAKTCMAEHGMDVDAVVACALSGEGDIMQLQAGNETVSLNPPHQFTPWIVVNGEAVGDSVMDLLPWLCAKLSEEQRGAVGACKPSKFRAVGGAQALHGRGGAKAPSGACYPTLHWDGTK